MIAPRLPLRFQLLIAIALVLTLFGSATLVAVSGKAAGEYREDIAREMVATLDALEAELAGALVINDYATVEQALAIRARRDNIDELAWIDNRGNAVRGRNVVRAAPARPDWFADWVELTPAAQTRPLRIGGTYYGRIEARFNAMQGENDLWQSVRLGALGLAGMLVATFGAVAVLLRRGLRPLERLADAAARIGAGDFGVRIADAPADPPEMRAALAAFNRMAASVEALIQQLAGAEESLRQSRDALEEKVHARTADLSGANAALTQEKAAQQALIARLEEAQNQLLQSEKMASIGQLAAGVAHEINNPVGFVSSNLTTLREYVGELLTLLADYENNEAQLPEAARRAILRRKTEIDFPFLREDLPNLLAESDDGVQRVRRIVEDLKNFSRVDAADWALANVEQGLDSTLRVVNNELKNKAEVVREFGGVPPIECLAGQLNQVFANLLVNAAQAIEQRGRIIVRTGHDAEAIWVEVEDNGGGIRPEHVQRIFEPFFTTKPVGKGTGLGLSLSYGIVRKHGGRIEVSSEIGRGTTFRVVLPIRRAAAAAPATEAGA